MLAGEPGWLLLDGTLCHTGDEVLLKEDVEDDHGGGDEDGGGRHEDCG